MARPREHYIIDGYNVIYAWPELRARTGELSEARDCLIQAMMEYGAYEHLDVTIVFDAQFTALETQTETHGAHVTVLYTAADETADSCIERLAYESVRARREVHVVTSDSAEQSVVLGAGAYRLPSRELRKRVLKAKERLRREYLAAPRLPLSRNEVGARLDAVVAEQLERLRRKGT